jgi:GT2 family glycosyltransferase
MVKSEFGWVDLLESKSNLGFGEGNNLGMKHALNKYAPEYLFLLNNDTIVTEGWLDSSVKVAEKNRSCGIVGSRLLNLDGSTQSCAGWIHRFSVKYHHGEKATEVGWVSGAAFLIRSEVIRKVGFFDHCFSPAYYEETDLEERVKQHGYTIIHNPDSKVFHLGAATTKILNDDFCFHLFYKNRVIFFVKNKKLSYMIARVPKDVSKAVRMGKLPLLLKAYRDAFLTVAR